tara:strand:+ start:582 stop:911 length:330 start_codon:yes stop_codon:yes gene_type:complete
MFKITEILKDLMIQEATTAKSSGQYSEPLGYISKRAWDSEAEFDQMGMEREPGEVVGVEIKTELPLEVDITKTSEVEEPCGECGEVDCTCETEDDDITKILTLLNQSKE